MYSPHNHRYLCLPVRYTRPKRRGAGRGLAIFVALDLKGIRHESAWYH